MLDATIRRQSPPHHLLTGTAVEVGFVYGVSLQIITGLKRQTWSRFYRTYQKQRINEKVHSQDGAERQTKSNINFMLAEYAFT